MKTLEKIKYIDNNYIKGIKTDFRKAEKRYNKIMTDCKSPKGIYNPSSIPWNDLKWFALMSERSSTKTTNLLLWFLNLYTMFGQTFAYVRGDSSMISRGAYNELFKIITDEHFGYIEAFTNGLFNNIEIVNGTPKKCYLVKVENGEIVARDDRYFCVLMSVDNSDAYTSVFNTTDTDYIFFDEFTRGFKKGDFIAFCNLIATLRRERISVKIILASNTISPYHEYLKELCISKELVNMVKGEKAIITSPLGARVYVEMLKVKIHDTKEFNTTALEYYGFPNDALRSLYGGEWEIKGFRHLPHGSVLTTEERIHAEYMGNLYCFEFRKKGNQPIILMREENKVPVGKTIFTDNVIITEDNKRVSFSTIVLRMASIERMGYLYFSTNEVALTYYAIKDFALMNKR